MGFSVSASTALIFAALFLAFGTLYPAMANGYERVEEADAAKADHNLDQAQTDIILSDVIVNDGGPSGQIQELTINVTNTGETTLTVAETDLIIQPDVGYVVWTNGANDDVRTFVEGDQGTNLWQPNETMEIEYDPGGNFDRPNRFKVISEHGVSVSGDV